MPLYDLNEFLDLSRKLTYQLEAATVSQDHLVATVLRRRKIPAPDKEILFEVIEYLGKAYGRKRRRLGPKAILHPLRAAGLLVDAMGCFNLLDVLSALLHDKFEDITEDDFPPAEWEVLEKQFHRLLKRIDPRDEWYLMERLAVLTRHTGNEQYYTYIGRLLDKAVSTPELLRVKLADRLDNTLDMRIDIYDPLEDVDFYSHLFQVLFVPSFVGYEPPVGHPPANDLNGSRRMYELFKTAVTLSLIRQKVPIDDDDTAVKLVDAICIASLKEAQRIIMHIFGYHFRDVYRQREVVRDTMEYCISGGTSGVTDAGAAHRLDGLFLDRFDPRDPSLRKSRLKELYGDKELMVQAALAFVVIFTNFRNDPTYYVHGVSEAGLTAA
ncbi:MAG: HD domain-containing protein [Deltaproteobacteria bacterium]|nr:HD domain-containing protein [Deltaproteobacteria bacterium]